MANSDQILTSFFAAPDEKPKGLCLLRLDGFFTALGIGPNLIMPSRWMERLLDGRPPMENIEEANLIMGALMERYNKVIKPLHGALSQYRPSCVPGDRSKTASLERVLAWCEGFVEALVLDPDWQAMLEDEAHRTFLGPIFLYAPSWHEAYEREESAKDQLERLTAFGTLLPELIFMIRDKVKDLPDVEPDVMKPRIKVGRNDICPCGSGKKYKRCCGSN